MSYLVKEGIFGEEDVTALQSAFPGEYGFDPRDASDGAHTSTVVNIVDGDLKDMAWRNAVRQRSGLRPGILPSAPTDLLHDPEHLLPSVVVTPTHIGPREQGFDPNHNAVLSCTGTVQQSMTPPPTPYEVHADIHPHPFYFHTHNSANMLTAKDAYAVLDIPENTDESMLWAAFSLRVRWISSSFLRDIDIRCLCNF